MTSNSALPSFAMPLSRALSAALTSILLALPLVLTVPAHAAEDKQDYSAAERLLFMSNQLHNVRPPTTLRYSFQKAGSIEPGFHDKVKVSFAKASDGQCCSATGEFLSAEHRELAPEVEHAEANPVILYFLEHDIREMQRLTKGSQTHFRKQIRMAVYQGATVREVSLPYRGKSVKGQEVAFSPYLDDPNRPKFEKLSTKRYLFTFSDEVPGGVYGIRTQVPGETPEAPALLVEELFVEGAEPAPR